VQGRCGAPAGVRPAAGVRLALEGGQTDGDVRLLQGGGASSRATPCEQCRGPGSYWQRHHVGARPAGVAGAERLVWWKTPRTAAACPPGGRASTDGSGRSRDLPAESRSWPTSAPRQGGSAAWRRRRAQEPRPGGIASRRHDRESTARPASAGISWHVVSLASFSRTSRSGTGYAAGPCSHVLALQYEAQARGISARRRLAMRRPAAWRGETSPSKSWPPYEASRHAGPGRHLAGARASRTHAQLRSFRPAATPRAASWRSTTSR